VSRTARLRLLVPLIVLGGPSAVPASAHESRTGGASMPDAPSVKTLRCADGAAFACGQGERLTVRGESLRRVRTVTFLGAPAGPTTGAPRRSGGRRTG